MRVGEPESCMLGLDSRNLQPLLFRQVLIENLPNQPNTVKMFLEEGLGQRWVYKKHPPKAVYPTLVFMRCTRRVLIAETFL